MRRGHTAGGRAEHRHPGGDRHRRDRAAHRVGRPSVGGVLAARIGPARRFGRALALGRTDRRAYRQGGDALGRRRGRTCLPRAKFAVLRPTTIKYAAARSPDGKIPAAGSDDGDIHLWDADGKPLAVLQGHNHGVRRLAWSPDGQILASAAEDDTVRLWDRAGKMLAELAGHDGRDVGLLVR
ncbi:MAG: hypothetical protein U0232_16445 [Thermomicrobiales bacterium]